VAAGRSGRATVTDAVIDLPSQLHPAVARAGYGTAIAAARQEKPVLLARSNEVHPDAWRRLSVELAASPRDIDAAQALRYRVFAGDLGAKVTGRKPARDQDVFDPWCEHLVARDEATNEIVGTYRVLTPERAQRLGTYYADTEFDLTRLARMRPGLCEVGRACIHPDYRSGAVIMRLWQGIASLMLRHKCDHLMGCASISMTDGGANALRVFRDVAPRHLAPIEYRVFPRHPLAMRDDRADAVPPGEASVPALLKGYLRLGAWIGGEPAWDPDFNTADLFVLLPLSRLEARYARHYFREAA
jgi:putative hemolysin